MRLFHVIKSALQKMPYGLRVATALSLIFTLFLPAAFIPFGRHSVNGVDVSFAEFWRRGGGIVFVCIGVISILFAYGFIRARRWIRPVVVALGLGLVILTVVDRLRFSEDMFVVFLLCGCLPVWYLYFSRSVREYFGVT